MGGLLKLPGGGNFGSLAGFLKPDALSYFVLAAAVKKIREALGDDAETPRYIETLPRRGYRFIYPVEVGEPVS